MTDKEQLRDKIIALKRGKNAIILAHNYQREEVQDIADYRGDSLELSRLAADTDCDVIVFCGVHFMAESASILSPDKTVLLPEISAGCPMADMIAADSARNARTEFPGFEYKEGFTYPPEFSLKDIKKRHPGVPVVTYVNTTAEVKAESDICCTSANAVKIVESLDSDKVICIPDKNLSAWIAGNTKKEVIAWDGFCHVHERATADDVRSAREAHPDALVLAHPECRMEVLEQADHVTSTSGMLRYAQSSDAKEFIIGTETGLMYKLKSDNTEKIFYPLRKDMVCPNMKKTSLNSVLHCLETETYKIKVPEEIRIPAKRALDRMLEVK
jgi:quinolinate synthase